MNKFIYSEEEDGFVEVEGWEFPDVITSLPNEDYTESELLAISMGFPHYFNKDGLLIFGLQEDELVF